jgi:MFS transporter, DHA1 family, multidrug resistance protein
MCVLVSVNQFGFGAMVPSLPLYAQTFGVPVSAIGLAVAIYGLARFVAAIPAGQLSDQLGRRHMLAIGGLISAVGSFWCAVAYGYADFIVARFIAGAGGGIVLTVGQIVLADISAPDRRGRNIATYQAAFLFGFGVGPYPGGLLAEHYGLAAPFLATAVTALIVTAIAWLVVPETRPASAAAGATGKTRESLSTLDFMHQMMALLRGRGLLLVSLIGLMNAVVRTGGLFALIPVLVTATLGLSVAQIGFAMMIGSLCGFITAYPAGWLTDRFGRKPVIVPSTVLTGLSMVVFCYAPSYAWFIVAAIIWNIGASISSSAPAAYVVDQAPPGQNAAAMSSYRMTADLGYIVGPIGLGLLADLTSPATAIIAASVGLVLTGVLFGMLAPESRMSADKLS